MNDYEFMELPLDDENSDGHHNFIDTDSNPSIVQGNSASDIGSKNQNPKAVNQLQKQETGGPIKKQNEIAPPIADFNGKRKPEQEFEASDVSNCGPQSDILAYKANPRKKSDQPDFIANDSQSKIIEELINPEFDARVSGHANFSKKKMENQNLNALREDTHSGTKEEIIFNESSFNSIPDKSLREESKKLYNLIPKTCDNCRDKPSQKAMLVSGKLKAYCVDCSRLTVAKRKKEKNKTGKEVPWKCILVVEGVAALAEAALESGIEISQSLRN